MLARGHVASVAGLRVGCGGVLDGGDRRSLAIVQPWLRGELAATEHLIAGLVAEVWEGPCREPGYVLLTIPQFI